MCVRNQSERVLFRSGMSYSDHSIRVSKSTKCEKGYTFHKNLESNGAKRGVFHCMSLKKEYTFSFLGPFNYHVFSEAHMLTQEK